jgi:hypothetical protein
VHSCGCIGAWPLLALDHLPDDDAYITLGTNSMTKTKKSFKSEVCLKINSFEGCESSET